MNTYLIEYWGDDYDNPSIEQLEKSLNELKVADYEHQEVALKDENEWFISAFSNGTVIFGNAVTGEEYKIEKVSDERIIQLWIWLQQGELEKIKQESWIKRK